MFSRDGGQDFYDGVKAEGWLPNDQGELVCPADPDLFMWRDAHSGQVLLSPKLIEELKRSMEGQCSPPPS